MLVSVGGRGVNASVGNAGVKVGVSDRPLRPVGPLRPLGLLRLLGPVGPLESIVEVANSAVCADPGKQAASSNAKRNGSLTKIFIQKILFRGNSRT